MTKRRQCATNFSDQSQMWTKPNAKLNVYICKYIESCTKKIVNNKNAIATIEQSEKWNENYFETARIESHSFSSLNPFICCVSNSNSKRWTHSSALTFFTMECMLIYSTAGYKKITVQSSIRKYAKRDTTDTNLHLYLFNLEFFWGDSFVRALHSFFSHVF